jgi:peroxiredoxin
VLGVSSQSPEVLRASTQHGKLAHSLLSDEELKLAAALDLPTLGHGDPRLYRRLTLMVRGGVIRHVFYPVENPAANADQILAWSRLKAR